MHRTFAGTVLSLLLAATTTGAQEPPANRLRLEPYAGAFNDSYDASPDGENTGVHLGLRLGYELGQRGRLIADAGYASTRNVSNPSGLESYFVYDNTWALTTVGGEYDVIPGRTSASLGLQVGAGWHRNDLAGAVGDPPAHTDWYSGGGFSAVDVVVPGLTVRHALSPRTALLLRVQDHIFDVLEGPAHHSPAVTVGVSLR